MEGKFRINEKKRQGPPLFFGSPYSVYTDIPAPRRLSLRGGDLLFIALPHSATQLFVSDDGFALLRGRDAKGNIAARKLAAAHDIWLHTDGGPGSHVIIRRAHAG